MAPRPSATDRPDTGREERPTIPTDLGERFAYAIAAQDAVALKALLAPDVIFRALTPGKSWESEGADAVVDDVILGKWFPPERSITAILRVDRGAVGAVGHVAYRFRARRPDGDFIIEQQAYLETDDDRICWLQILCSGFVPTPAVSGSPARTGS
jgi:hypothetical protein